ncbi:MAG: polyprenyl synthetase family protein [Actinomycetaceae bacterium]|nr:polyprenyl synthetase family protein [Actinomycetaceae bacterium]
MINSDATMASELTHALEKVEDLLHETSNVDDLMVAGAVTHLTRAGGKRLRPALCLLTARLGPNSLSPEVYDAAVLVELTHIATLYHDDVMDEAPLRRGVPSAHYLYGNSSAILAGDVLFARASSIAAKLGPEAVRLHAETFERLCLGQLQETIGPSAEEDPIAHYINVLAGKTGSLIASSGRYGVMFSGGSRELADDIAQYGEKVGVAFQIADDVIDLVSDPEVTGKTPGTDLLEGVPTMPTLLLRKHRAEGTLDQAGEEILDFLETKNLNEGDNLAQVVGMLRAHSVVEETRALAHQWIDEAVDHLANVPEGEVKQALELFARAMVDRYA